MKLPNARRHFEIPQLSSLLQNPEMLLGEPAVVLLKTVAIRDQGGTEQNFSTKARVRPAPGDPAPPQRIDRERAHIRYSLPEPAEGRLQAFAAPVQ
jgi:hypothetical protein